MDVCIVHDSRTKSKNHCLASGRATEIVQCLTYTIIIITIFIHILAARRIIIYGLLYFRPVITVEHYCIVGVLARGSQLQCTSP